MQLVGGRWLVIKLEGKGPTVFSVGQRRGMAEVNNEVLRLVNGGGGEVSFCKLTR